MKFVQRFPWVILPTQTKNECFDKNCINIYSSNDVTLHKDTVYSVDLGVYVIDMDPGTMLEVKSHLCDKPWRVVNRYLFPSIRNRNLVVQLISNKHCSINTGDVIAHIQPISIIEVQNNIRSKLPFIVSFKVKILKTIFNFAGRDDIFYSDDDDDDDDNNDENITKIEYYIKHIQRPKREAPTEWMLNGKRLR